MPEVSVVIPTYNRSHLVGQAVASVLGQSFTDLEVTVVDDGSEDDTRSVIGAIDDSRLRYVHQDNAGLAAARNTGIRASSGAWVACLDDDDAWFPEKLAQQMAVCRSQPEIGLVNSGWVCVDGAGAAISQVAPWLWQPRLDLETWLVACPAVPSAVLVRRDWLQRVGGFDESLSREACGAEDWDLWLRLSYEGCPMAWARALVCAYRIHAESMSKNAVRQRQSMMIALGRFFASPDLPDAILSQKGRVYARAHLRGAARLYAAGLTAAAGQDVAAALALDPGLLDQGGEKLAGALMGWIGDPMVGDPVQYAAAVFDHLPATAAHLAHRRRAALAQAAKQALFNAHFRKDRGSVLRHLRLLAANDLNALGDVGVWSAAAEAVLGQAVMAGVRRIVRRVRSQSGRQVEDGTR